MPINYEDYLSTSIRWAMFKADWPDATVDFSEGTAADVGIPSSFTKKDEKLCVAKVSRFTGDDRVITAFKSQGDVRGAKDTDSWHALCSKAMGRALKKAGYPDTMSDLKILMKFREAKTGAKVANQIEPMINVAPVVETKSIIAGQTVSNKVPDLESKETPRPLDSSWKSEEEKENAHRTFKAMCSDLSPDQLEELREHHDKLNNRQWPMQKSELNNLIIALGSIREVSEPSDDLVSSEKLKALVGVINAEAKAQVIKEFGEPSTWEEMITEELYNQIMDVLELTEEE
jgi:hypothetical protein